MSIVKPCPFCGSRAKLEKHKFSELPGTFSVRCTKCRAESWPFYGSEEDAFRAWNMREEAKHRPKTNGQKFEEVFGEVPRRSRPWPAQTITWWYEPYEEPKEAK